ncbi:hypothetical protein CH63R_02870 [Colletotrichum higginsianum IMI 349063]|uniref:Uncharacterized protein n=1 Tax=Colletotrichum higginsianum (strain IMI 349063) TaxID=759273 RepID=A0A1B7YQC2_COLHI|nr:hypothetical protein CH63R_02870 [Colletotrichum higginsianum IMI 349063]OBR14144.1 hypothetical protein CH63R_02870 [Colletotrichum higginsianum IMI 349063]
MASSHKLINNNPAGGANGHCAFASAEIPLPGSPRTRDRTRGGRVNNTGYDVQPSPASPPPPPTDQPNLTICRFIAQTPSQDKAWAALAADTKHYTQHVSSRTSLAYPAAAVQ